MWEIGSRGVVGLISVFVGLVILYNAWGLILVLAILLFLVVNTCYSLLINDSLVSPHNIVAFEYAKAVASELNLILERVILLISRYIRDLADAAKRYYHQRQNSNSNMHRPRRSSYHLSSDSFSVNARDRNSNVDQLSPIPRRNLQQVDEWNEGNQFVESAESVIKHTSTPLLSWKKENVMNGEPGEAQQDLLQRSQTKIAPLQGQNHTLSRGEETMFSPEGSPWGTSISPKMRAKAAGVKTVQTVAGPLLASTRYNIDTKVYSDATSPGLTTRLSKYASEIGNKLLHQSQYGMGHFPKVNLNASPTPLINTKAAKMRMPVTVRIAQPDAMRYSSSERHKMLNMVCHPENKSPNVVQALREISLKRHASREDVTSELVKKQRTDGIFSEELETLEEMTQKRARDESSKSDEEASPSHLSSRPLKRSKAQSCNDILNSLSSSMHVLSGVKRKATDISRSSTPDFEKHFKSLDKSQDDNFSTFPEQNETPKSTQRFASDPLPVINVPINPDQKGKPWRKTSPKGIFNTIMEDQSPENESKSADHLEIKIPAKSSSSPVKLADKLFMRAEPQNNEKLRTLIAEQANVKDKFSMVDKDEIKKKDIVNMRQTSMKARLQSMFDAISGKGANKINPDVVIHAEEIKDPASSEASAVLTTLSSSTTTTNVNTSPITSPVVPILKSTSNKKSPTKHVTFSIASGQPTSTMTSSISPIEHVSSKSEDATKAPTSASFSVSPASIGNTTAPTFSFGSTSTEPTSTIQGPFNVSTSVAAPANRAPLASSNSAEKTAISSIPTSTFTSINTPKSLNTTQILSTPSVITQSVNTTQSSNTPQSLNTSQSFNSSQNLNTTQSSGFAFGAIAKSQTSTSLPTFGQNSSVDKTISSTPASIPSTTFATPNFNLTTSTPASATTFSFGTSNPISQPSIEQTTPKTQPPPAFGSVSSSFSFPGNAAPVSSSSNPKPTETSSSGFKAPITTPSFSFGNAPATTKSFSFGASAATTSAPIFGASNSTPTFGAATNPTPSSAANPVSNLPTTSPPAFGTPANTTPNFASSASSSFGAVSNSTLNFGAANTSGVKSFGTPATTPSMFGSPVIVTTSSVFGSANTQPIFGNASSGTASAFGPPKTTASIFGSASNTPSFGTAPSAPSLFSNSNATSTTPSTLPTFGTPVTTSNVFSQGNSSINSPPPAYGASTNSSGLFSGANAISTTSSNSTVAASSSIFSQAKAPPAFGATSSSFGNTGPSVFGAASTNSTGFNATSPPANPPPAYGSTNTAAPIFGAQTSGTAATGTQNSSFGFGTTTSNAPSFGSTSTTTTGFGSTTNSSFPAQNNSGISFGTGNNNPPPAFGSTRTPFGSQGGTNVFGNAGTSPPPPPPAYGAATANSSGGNNNANTGGAFTFGTGGNQQTQPASTFSFGGASTNNNTSNNNAAAQPFQFGSAAPNKPATGFNFNAPSATPNINFGAAAPSAFNAPPPGANNFAAPAGGMFSIGTGSTAPRSRTTRPRRQR